MWSETQSAPSLWFQKSKKVCTSLITEIYIFYEIWNSFAIHFCKTARAVVKCYLFRMLYSFIREPWTSISRIVNLLFRRKLQVWVPLTFDRYKNSMMVRLHSIRSYNFYKSSSVAKYERGKQDASFFGESVMPSSGNMKFENLTFRSIRPRGVKSNPPKHECPGSDSPASQSPRGCIPWRDWLNVVWYSSESISPRIWYPWEQVFLKLIIRIAQWNLN